MKKFKMAAAALMLSVMVLCATECKKPVEPVTPDTPDTPTLPAGVIDGLYTVNENGGQVYFAQGNLQYIGSAEQPYWKFAERQWDFLAAAQNGTSDTIDRDLFGFATSGYDHGAQLYQPWSTYDSNSKYYAYGDPVYNLYDQDGKAEWGYNAIKNGGNTENSGWRTPTKDEWVYLFNERVTPSGIRYVKGTIKRADDEVRGLILLPDAWDTTLYVLTNINLAGVNYDGNVITEDDWDRVFEANGVVFLPAAGYRSYTSAGGSNNGIGDYWSSSVFNSSSAYILNFRTTMMDPEYHNNSDGRHYGRAVRLVLDVD